MATVSRLRRRFSFKVPITSNFLLSHLILHNTKLIFSQIFRFAKTYFLYIYIFRFLNWPPFWYTIHTSHPPFKSSCDLGSGRCDLNRDLADL